MMTDRENEPTDTDQQRSEQTESKKFALAHKTYESLSNTEFMAIHKTLTDIKKRLSHEEFGFARYLLEMAIQEFIMPGDENDTLSK